MIADIRPLPPQLSADAAEFFGQAYKIFSDITSVVSETIGGTFNEVASSVGEVAGNVARCTADIFSDFARWAQENPAYSIGGLVGIFAVGFGLYFLVGIAKAHYRNVTTENRLQTDLDTAIANQAKAEKTLDKARANYFSAYGYRHLIQHHRTYFPVSEEVSVLTRNAEIRRLGNLNSAAVDPGEAESTSIAHYRFLYQKAAESKLAADAEYADKNIARRTFHREPVFVW